MNNLKAQIQSLSISPILISLMLMLITHSHVSAQSSTLTIRNPWARTLEIVVHRSPGLEAREAGDSKAVRSSSEKRGRSKSAQEPKRSKSLKSKMTKIKTLKSRSDKTQVAV